MRLKHVKGADEIIKNGTYYVPNPKEYRGKWNSLFQNSNPIYIEIGTGKGDFLIENACRYPNINYIGIERFDSVMVRAIQKSNDLKLKNFKLIRMNAEKIEDIFNREVDVIYLNFSDPWPKARHAKRRLTYKTFLDKYYMLLKKGGKIIMKTDNLGLFEYSLESIQEHGKFKLVEYTFDYEFDSQNDGMSEYERKFREIGTKINRLVCIKE